MTNAGSDESPLGVPSPDPELKRLEPLLGTWRAEDHTRESVLGPGVRVTSSETFDWLDGGYFLVSTYETVFGAEPAQRGVNYWGYDSQAKRFRIVFFSNNGPFTEDGNRYEGAVADGKLTFEGPARFQYELDDHGRIKTNADRQHLRDRGGGRSMNLTFPGESAETVANSDRRRSAWLRA
jgi:hypothetical protein